MFKRESHPKTKAGLTSRVVRELSRNEQGAVAVYVAAAAAVLFGMAALAFDLGRFFTLNTQLQSAADAAAMAAAAELNGQTGARDRAIEAATSAFVSNMQSFGEGGTNVTVTLTYNNFLTSLDPDTVAANDAEARFVRVDVAPRNLPLALYPVLGGQTTFSTGTTATAGFTQVACKIPPLMICNPYEGSSPTSETPFSATEGQQILVKSHSGPSGGQWAPGTFGLLDPPQGNQGAQNVAGWMASGVSPGCYSVPMSVRPGQADSVRTALNTRFDMYENPFFGGGNDKKNPAYRPAANVVKGLVPVGGDPCTTAASASAKGMPRDGCFTAGTCTRFGNSSASAPTWDRAGYWAANHPSGVAMPSSLTTRYKTYRWEIENNAIPSSGDYGPSAEFGNATNAAKRCYSNNTASGQPSTSASNDRRVLHLAVVNCRFHDVQGNEDDLQPVAFVEVFLTEPSGLVSTQAEIWMEVIKVVDANNTNDVIHDVVQLYR